MRAVVVMLASVAMACGNGSAIDKACEAAWGNDAKLSIEPGETAETAPVLTGDNVNTLILVGSLPRTTATSKGYVRLKSPFSNTNAGVLLSVAKLGNAKSLPSLPVEVTVSKGGTVKKRTGPSPCEPRIDELYELVIPSNAEATFAFGPTNEPATVRLVLEHIPELSNL